ncbi:MAG: hypothetical protein FWD31_09300 [Planctomycetaceae bacterium]|nr:hypothetical protein [Planctomycetaceae bacterium]
MPTLIINDELKNLLPPLSAEEFAGLEADIQAHGCLAPVIAWDGILVDGHHRYEICTKHEIPFSVQTIVFDDLDAAKLWAWKHQENRRNLTTFHRSELALKLKDVIAAKARERQRAAGGDKSKTTSEALLEIFPKAVNTRKELAEIAGVSDRTLAKAEYIVEHADEETKENLRHSENGTSINKEYNRLKAEAKADNIESQPFGEAETETTEYYPPLSQPIPEKDSQFVQTVKLQNIPVNDPERLIACLFDLFNVKYREKLVPNLMAKIRSDDGEKTAGRIMTKLNKMFTE